MKKIDRIKEKLVYRRKAFEKESIHDKRQKEKGKRRKIKLT